MFHSCLISSKFIYTISFPIRSCLYDNKPPFAQMCCNSCLFLCAEVLEGPHTEKLHLSSPLPLSHQLQKWAKRALHNRVIPQESANPALVIMKSFYFFFFCKRGRCWAAALWICSSHRTGRNWRTANCPDPGCSFITFDHESRLVDFTPAW